MKDNYGREIKYMRISVTDRCNLRCRYCMPAEGVQSLGHDKILTFEEIEQIVRAAVKLGITKYRITGGEPLVRKDIVKLVENLAKIDGVEELAMTTNGILLEQHAEALKKAGLHRVNVSVDSLIYRKFKEISRGGDLDTVFKGINKAIGVGLKPVKLNVVVMKGFNDDEILNFVQLTLQHPVDVRFIELMPIGHPDIDQQYQFMSCDEIKKKLPALIHLPDDDGVADNYKYPGGIGKIGFISPISNHFCDVCNKIRLTADGKLKPCLHSNQEIDLHEILKTGDDTALEEALKNSIYNKEQKHHLNDGAEPIDRDMNKIGG